MTLRLLVLVGFILFLVAAYFKGSEVQDKECIQLPCNYGYANACVLRSNKIEIKGNSCAPEMPEDVCYQQYGVCERSGDGCGWQQTTELEDCLTKAKLANAKNLNNSKKPE